MTTEVSDVEQLGFTARALAQTHPMTEAATRHRQAKVDQERLRQPIPELADWAGTALLVGYCLRRAEAATTGVATNLDSPPPAELDGLIVTVVDQLRSGDAAGVTIIDAPTLVSALDGLIARELDKRHDNLRDQLDDDAWRELEEYIAHWAVHGYALRAVEEGVRP